MERVVIPRRMRPRKVERAGVVQWHEDLEHLRWRSLMTYGSEDSR